VAICRAFHHGVDSETPCGKLESVYGCLGCRGFEGACKANSYKPDDPAKEIAGNTAVYRPLEKSEFS
jgi:hypothetical protein